MPKFGVPGNEKRSGKSALQPAPSGGDPLSGLSGIDRDAAIALTNLFKSYGLETLAPRIIGFVKQGYSADTISILLQDTDEYKKRFSANDARRKAGLPVLNPAEYLATESSYRDIMRQAGLPTGFYDQVDDFTSFMAKDVSPTELKSRVDKAAEVVNQADPAVLEQFRRFYGARSSDVIAYVLDMDRAMPLVERQLRAAQLAGAASNQRVDIDQATAERLAALGVSTDQARSGFNAVAQESQNVQKLSSLYGENVGQDDLISSVFESNSPAAQKVKKLASRERAAFSGSSSQSRSSLSNDSAGSF